MWYLKFKYKHSDCIYASKLEELNLTGQFQYMGCYVKDNYVYTSAILQLSGNDSNIKKYIQYLKNNEKIEKIEIHKNAIFILAKHKKELGLYRATYDSIFIHPTPAYLSDDGFEIVEIACWDRKPLEELIAALKQNKTTTYFELLKFVSKKMDNIYVSKLLPELSPKQNDAIKLAFSNGYYEFPKKINLDELANISCVSKPTFRENLRKAEAKLMPKLVSK